MTTFVGYREVPAVRQAELLKSLCAPKRPGIPANLNAALLKELLAILQEP